MSLPACAVLSGLAPEDEEVLSLLLEIIGWKPTVAAQPSEHALRGMRLVFVGQACFESVTSTPLSLATMLVLVTDPSLPITTKSQAVVRLASPINLPEAEQLINAISASLSVQDG